MLSVVNPVLNNGIPFSLFTVFGSFVFAAPLSEVVGKKFHAAFKRRSVKVQLFVADTEKIKPVKAV